MNWTKVKNGKQVVLDGITIEIDRSDTSVMSITLKDAAGHVVRARYESYNMYIEVPAAPKTVEKVALNGTVLGLPVKEVFDSEYQANDRKEELTGHLDEKKFALEVEKVQIPDDDIPW